jgi:hypothetical protein
MRIRFVFVLYFPSLESDTFISKPPAVGVEFSSYVQSRVSTGFVGVSLMGGGKCFSRVFIETIKFVFL